jgi:hypothetical protein
MNETPGLGAALHLIVRTSQPQTRADRRFDLRHPISVERHVLAALVEPVPCGADAQRLRLIIEGVLHAAEPRLYWRKLCLLAQRLSASSAATSKLCGSCQCAPVNSLRLPRIWHQPRSSHGRVNLLRFPLGLDKFKLDHGSLNLVRPLRQRDFQHPIANTPTLDRWRWTIIVHPHWLAKAPA